MEKQELEDLCKRLHAIFHKNESENTITPPESEISPENIINENQNKNAEIIEYSNWHIPDDKKHLYNGWHDDETEVPVTKSEEICDKCKKPFKFEDSDSENEWGDLSVPPKHYFRRAKISNEEVEKRLRDFVNAHFNGNLILHFSNDFWADYDYQMGRRNKVSQGTFQAPQHWRNQPNWWVEWRMNSINYIVQTKGYENAALFDDGIYWIEEGRIYRPRGLNRERIIRGDDYGYIDTTEKVIYSPKGGMYLLKIDGTFSPFQPHMPL